MQILRHYLPDKDLDLETLRSIAGSLEDDGNYRAPDTMLSPSPDDDDRDGGPGSKREDAEPANEEINLINETMGCLMMDSLGKYRYILELRKK